MSVKIMARVWKLELSTSRKMVLLKMADVANDDGANSFQSVAFIAAHTGQGERTVQRHRSQFENDGVLIVEAFGKGGRGRFKNFRIDIERAEGLYGNIEIEARKGVKSAPFKGSEKAANRKGKGANSSDKGCQSLADDSSLSMSIDTSRAHAAGSANGPQASTRGSSDARGDRVDHQAMIAEFKNELLPKIQEAVGDHAFQAFGGCDMSRVCNQGTVGRLVIGQPTRHLRDLTLQRQADIAQAIGMDVEVVIQPCAVGRGYKT